MTDSPNKKGLTVVVGNPIPTGCPVGGIFPKDRFQDVANYYKVARSRGVLFKRYPFWGYLAMTLSFVEDTSGYVSTFATDGQHIFYSAEFVSKYSTEELIFVDAHEIYHILLDHIRPDIKDHRRGERNPRLWAKAKDYVINIDLVDSKIGVPPKDFPLCLNEKYRGWTVEAVYDDLLLNADNNFIEVHFTVSDESPMDAERSKADWINTIQQALSAQRDAENAGTCSGGSLSNSIRRIIGDIHKSKKDWKVLLRKYLQTTVSRGYSYIRPNKVAFNSGFGIPGFRVKGNEYDLTIAVDTSGSINAETLSKVMGEVLGMMKQLVNVKIGIFAFDQEVYKESFTKIESRTRSEVGIQALMPFLNVIKGGGGTMFETIWEFLDERKVRPKILLVLTDGYPNNSWGNPSYCPTLFLIVNEQNPNIRAPFGTTIYYEQP